MAPINAIFFSRHCHSAIFVPLLHRVVRQWRGGALSGPSAQHCYKAELLPKGCYCITPYVCYGSDTATIWSRIAPL